MNFSRKVLEKLLKEHPKAEIKIMANNEIVPEYWNKACDCSIDICTVEEWAVLGDEYLDESDCIDKLEEFEQVFNNYTEYVKGYKADFKSDDFQRYMPTYREGIEKGKNIDEINKQFDKEVNPNKFFDFFRE